MARQYEFVQDHSYNYGTVLLPKTTSKFLLTESTSDHALDSRITSEQEPYTIIDIANVSIDPWNPKKKGRLTIAMAPGKKDNRWNRQLDSDLKLIQLNGIQVIVCLLEWSEMRMLNIVDYPRRAEEAGLLFYHLPIRDCGVASQNEIKVLIPILVKHLVDGYNILIHCREGLGRAGTMCACCLTHFGYDAKNAIDIVRRRRPRAIQNQKQEESILQYYQQLLC